MPELNAKPYLVIGTPCFGRQVTDIYAASLLKLQMACFQHGIPLLVHMLGGDALITRARQNIVARFLSNEEATHLLFIDADIGFQPEQVFRLLRFGAGMCSAVYPIKRLEWEKIEACVQSARAPLQSASLTYMLEFEDGEQIQMRDGFAKVSFAGTGFLMIRREALLAMLERYPELKYEREHGPAQAAEEAKWRYALFNCMLDEASGFYLSEDFSFCRRWTDLGGEIWADMQSRLTHLGSVPFEGNVATQFTPARASEEVGPER
jgi:hypothetical protein